MQNKLKGILLIWVKGILLIWVCTEAALHGIYMSWMKHFLTIFLRENNSNIPCKCSWRKQIVTLLANVFAALLSAVVRPTIGWLLVAAAIQQILLVQQPTCPHSANGCPAPRSCWKVTFEFNISSWSGEMWRCIQYVLSELLKGTWRSTF